MYLEERVRASGEIAWRRERVYPSGRQCVEELGRGDCVPRFVRNLHFLDKFFCENASSSVLRRVFIKVLVYSRMSTYSVNKTQRSKCQWHGSLQKMLDGMVKFQDAL